MESKSILSNLENQHDNKIVSEQDASLVDSDINSSQAQNSSKKKVLKETIVCTCGKTISRSSMAYHTKTQEHIKKEKEIREKKIFDSIEKSDVPQKDNQIIKSEQNQKSEDDGDKLKLCSCGERISVANMASHVKRKTHINKIAEQYARIQEIDKMDLTPEMKKILVDKILIKSD